MITVKEKKRGQLLHLGKFHKKVLKASMNPKPHKTESNRDCGRKTRSNVGRMHRAWRRRQAYLVCFFSRVYGSVTNMKQFKIADCFQCLRVHFKIDRSLLDSYFKGTTSELASRVLSIEKEKKKKRGKNSQKEFLKLHSIQTVKKEKKKIFEPWMLQKNSSNVERTHRSVTSLLKIIQHVSSGDFVTQ